MSWKRKSAKRRSISHSRLRLERLEDRSLLAVAAFSINLFHDDGGVPGKPLANEPVEAGQAFFAQIVGREYHPGFSGLAGVSLDIAWDADVLSIVEPFDPRAAVTPNLPLFVEGRLYQQDPLSRPFRLDNQIRQNVGTIDGLGGSASVSSGVGKPIGSDGDDRYVKPEFLGLSTTDDHFAWLHFRAEQPGEALLTMRQGGLRIVTLPASTLSSQQLHFETQIVTVVEPAAAGQILLPEAAPLDGPPSDAAVVSDDTTSVAKTPAAAVPVVPIHDDPEPPTQSESLFEPAPKPHLQTPLPVTNVIVEPPPSEESSLTLKEAPASLTPVWHNATYPLDVDGTGRVAPVDVVIIVNYLNVDPGRWELPAVQTPPPRYLDVNGDGRCTPHDAMLVINYIDRRVAPAGEGEFSSPYVTASDVMASAAGLAPAAVVDDQLLAVAPIAVRRGRELDVLPFLDSADSWVARGRHNRHVVASLRDA